MRALPAKSANHPKTTGQRANGVLQPNMASSISEASEDTYTQSYYDAAIAKLSKLKRGKTYQANDAAVLLPPLRLSRPATSGDCTTLTDAELRDLCRSGKALPPRVIVSDRGIPYSAPRSLQEMADRALEVYGGT